MDEIQMTEPKQLSSVNHEAPEFLESYYDENNLYQLYNMSLVDTKEKIDWPKRALEYKSSYIIENPN